MRQPKAEWARALQMDWGANAQLRYNETVGRWEFLIPCGDGVCRSQFWGWFYSLDLSGNRKKDRAGNDIVPDRDPVTDMPPFRDLDDQSFEEARQNLLRTFIGSSVKRHMDDAKRFNRDLMTQKYREAGNAFGDLAGERAHRLRGDLVTGWIPALEK